ncbi:hypothetical protein D910_10995 [Dendroctonus ponderosae]|uniref:Uncharacterized protein n=1 Tax=Dendroctonus ponderosae TaxID=77166 RepID=U4UMI8_DENPD|nr:hypothetical protein D910_10995 [Dendroctonus ponderosae]
MPVAAPSNTTVINNSSSGEVTEIPKSESPVSEQKSENPTRPPTIDISTTAPALVRDVSSSTPMPNNQPKNKSEAASSVSPKKEGKSGASVLNAGVVIVGVAVLLTSVGFSWKL